MTPRWEDLDARARGLATHLLGPAALAALAAAPDLPTLAAALRRLGYAVPEGAASAAALEVAVRRMAGARLGVLARWAGRRTALLAVVFEDEDRRSLRALVRGALAQAPAEARLAGLVPTPALPERALQELARQASPGAVAALLTAWRHPYGPALRGPAAAAQPDPWALELALDRTFATRAVRAARRSRALLEYVRETIDLENAYTALALAGEERELSPRDTFLPGGARLDRAAFAAAAAAGTPAAAGRRLARALAGAPFAPAFDAHATDPVRLEDAVLRLRLRALERAMRTAPLGPAPVLAYALRLRAETVALRRIIWGVALGAPPEALAALEGAP